MQLQTTTPEGAVKGNTLREAMEIRRVRGERFSLKEAVGITVPLCTQVASLHEDGKTFFLHPSALDHGRAGTELVFEHAGTPPTHERDRACLAPEERKGQHGDSRASVFSIGAILYELLTGDTVGPGMKRPTEAVPGLPSNLEVLLGKALVADPKHRPGDLGALAQALHQLCPSGSMPPPEADVSRLDGDADFEVDVSLSMIPPAPSGKPPRVVPIATKSSPRVVGDGPFAVVEAHQAAPPPSGPNLADPTARLAALKEQLESDPRPRYIVIKDGMDHGPFTAVELLQQIASASFVGEHHVRDTISSEERMISEWEHFSQFAEHAKLNRDIKREKRAFEAVVVAEKQSSRWKTLAGLTLLGMIGAAGIGVLMRHRLDSKHNDEVQGDKATAIDVDGGIGSGKDDKKVVGGGHWTGAAGSYPQVAGGGSCEAAKAKYVEEYNLGGGNGMPPDLGAADFGNVLNKGSYLNSCGVPSSMTVSICAAVQNGRAVGVTVSTKPSSPGISSCISGQIRGLSFPAHPRLDIATTTFAGQ